jgi:hypothetical protein
MAPQLPHLQILPLNLLVLHEEHDNQRTLPLVEKLRAQGILRNPPIVMPLNDGSGRYMVLDGANRVTSLQEMEFPHIVAQVVEADDMRVQLMTWNHVVWGMDMLALVTRLRDEAGLTLNPIHNGKPEFPMPHHCEPVQVQLADRRAYYICTSADPVEQAHQLNKVVDCYKAAAKLDRTNTMYIEAFKDVHPDLTALVIFPPLSIENVLAVGAQGYFLPTGITRFTVSPRALHLNYPLHELSSAKPIEYKEAYLQHWVQERIKHKNMRYYAEATFIFDE